MKITIDNTEEQIDWNKQKILENKELDYLVITNGVHTELKFEGLILDINDALPQFDKSLIKEDFKLFKGTISN